MLRAISAPLTSNQKNVNAAGTVYNLTNTAAAIDFGTTDPNITLDQAGTYLILGAVNLLYNAATFAAARDVTIKVRRTNNTPADLGNGLTRVLKTDIITTLSYSMPQAFVAGIYTTTNADDALALFGDVSTVPSAGNLQAVEANLIAIRLS